MRKPSISIKYLILSAFLICLMNPFHLHANAGEVNITIHLRGVYESKISLLALSISKTFKPIIELQGIKNGETATLSVAEEYLPGEFVLRFDYK